MDGGFLDSHYGPDKGDTFSGYVEGPIAYMRYVQSSVSVACFGAWRLGGGWDPYTRSSNCYQGHYTY